MSATPARGALPPDALAAMKKENGFLHILRHGTGAAVRGALEDILRFGSATIPDVWLSARDLIEKGLEPAVP